MATIIRIENDQFQYKNLVSFYNNIGFGVTSGQNPSADFQLPLIVFGSEGMGVPIGTTDERPLSGAYISFPIIRFNSDDNELEIYKPALSGWYSLEGGTSGVSVPSLISVSAMPISGVYSTTYNLTQTDGNYAIGYYVYDGNGWFCERQTSGISLTSTAGVLSETLVAGVTYDLSVSENITSFGVDMDAYGSVVIMSTNLSGYTISDPAGGGIFKRTLIGLDDLSTGYAEIIINKNNFGRTYSVVELLTV